MGILLRSTDSQIALALDVKACRVCGESKPLECYHRRSQYGDYARARERGVSGKLSRLVVLEMDDRVCGICGEDVDPFDFHVDHIIPLAEGGEHSYANVQVAHPSCNTSKRHTLPWLYEREGVLGAFDA